MKAAVGSGVSIRGNSLTLLSEIKMKIYSKMKPLKIYLHNLLKDVGDKKNKNFQQIS